MQCHYVQWWVIKAKNRTTEDAAQTVFSTMRTTGYLLAWEGSFQPDDWKKANREWTHVKKVLRGEECFRDVKKRDSFERATAVRIYTGIKADQIEEKIARFRKSVEEIRELRKQQRQKELDNCEILRSDIARAQKLLNRERQTLRAMTTQTKALMTARGFAFHMEASCDAILRAPNLTAKGVKSEPTKSMIHAWSGEATKEGTTWDQGSVDYSTREKNHQAKARTIGSRARTPEQIEDWGGVGLHQAAADTRRARAMGDAIIPGLTKLPYDRNWVWAWTAQGECKGRNSKPGALTAQRLQQYLDWVADEIGCGQTTPYDFKHLGCRILAATRPLDEALEHTGHAQASSLAAYTKPNADDLAHRRCQVAPGFERTAQRMKEKIARVRKKHNLDNARRALTEGSAKGRNEGANGAGTDSTGQEGRTEARGRPLYFLDPGID